MTTTDARVLRTIIPAEPGWYVFYVFLALSDEAPSIDLHPIIAWSVTVDLEDGPDGVAPITLAGRVSRSGDEGFEGFKRPDGKFEIDGLIVDDEAYVLAMHTDEGAENRPRRRRLLEEPA